MTGVALLSGGLDSTVAAAVAHASAGLDLVLTIDYGQRAAASEIWSARQVGKQLNVRHRSVRLDFLGELTTTALVNRGESLPFLSRSEIDDSQGAAAESMRRVWVPNRNGLFIAIAAAFAEGCGAEEVVVGFNREEAATFPDNSCEFLERTNESLRLSTLSCVRVVAPTAELDKAGIVRLGYESGAPLEYLWSCYEGGPRHCWSCESCLRLRRALEETGQLDRFEKEWRGDER